MYEKTKKIVEELKLHLLKELPTLKIMEIGAIKFKEEYDCWQDKGCELDKQLVAVFIEESPNITKEQIDELISSTTVLIEKYQSPGYAAQYIIEAIEKLPKTATN